MLICNPYEIVIEGTTHKGKTFRPSDWAERLCGVLASFDQGHKLSYHQWVRPILVDHIRCVTIDRKLEQISPDMFNFLMNFAHDNDLRVLDCKSLLEEHDSHQQISLSEAVQQNSSRPASSPKEIIKEQTIALPTQTPSELRELAPAEIISAFKVLQKQYPHLHDLAQFEELVLIQQAEGYRLLAIFEENQPDAVAVCGFRIATNFAFERYLNIDELVILNEADYHNYGTQLIQAIQSIAQDAHCYTVQTNIRQIAEYSEYIYLEQGFNQVGHCFNCHISNNN